MLLPASLELAAPEEDRPVAEIISLHFHAGGIFPADHVEYCLLYPLLHLYARLSFSYRIIKYYFIKVNFPPQISPFF